MKRWVILRKTATYLQQRDTVVRDNTTGEHCCKERLTGRNNSKCSTGKDANKDIESAMKAG